MVLRVGFPKKTKMGSGGRLFMFNRMARVDGRSRLQTPIGFLGKPPALRGLSFLLGLAPQMIARADRVQTVDVGRFMNNDL